MKIEAWITWELRDKHGQLKSYEKKRANSIVRGLVDILQSMMAQASVTNGATNTAGVNFNTPLASVNFSANAALNDGTFGPVVGTGSTAVAVTQYALAAIIANGTGSGQLTHGTVAFTNPATSGSTRSFTVQRVFTNNSGGSITVNEVGIYMKASASIVMMDRTLSTKTINNGTTGTLTYTLGVTV